MTSIKLCEILYLKQLRKLTKMEAALFIFLLILIPNGLANATLRLNSLGIKAMMWAIIYGIIGFLIQFGISISISKVEEVRFLWSIGKGNWFLTQYTIVKKIPFLILLLWIVVGQILWDVHHNYIFSMVSGLILGVLLAEIFWYITLFRKFSGYAISFFFLSLVVVYFILPMSLSVRILTWILLCISMGYITLYFAQRSWSVFLQYHGSKKVLGRRGWLSQCPLLKKELLFIIRPVNLFSFFILALGIEVLNSYIIRESPFILSISSAILSWFAVDIWAVKSLVIEEKGLLIYKATLFAWKKMLRTKWLILCVLNIGIIFMHQWFWGIYLQISPVILSIQTIWSIFLSTTLISLGMPLGYKFLSIDYLGNYRIKFLGSWVIAMSMLLLLYLHQFHKVLFVAISVMIYTRFILFYKKVS
ncbi:hypothetical protein [Paenibacillus polymyxa]|uniref:Uncharacterized protein n=1 Tax=Paenibacillus polymyxa (strain SC2) TaxID=886882 RepID=E3E6W3_PAEPS|nr:hypothetical protein [Paenibacillus polymyxa]ADO58515.1 hypothetical protein PPSC2_21410 [Paenibacillus polymyxa SC2]WPQ56160.1 hypothetical protein SKN87_21760 [Paenibacillus polymyxa]